MHEKIGKCNSDELFNIINKLSPEVIFLEASDKSYSEYEKHLFTEHGEYHKKLEISAIQKYSNNTSFYYVPVCVNGLRETLNKKNILVSQNVERQDLIKNFISLAFKNGFEYLNSVESTNLLEEIRVLENRILNGHEMNKILKEDIEAYENPMIQNIYSYCKNNQFDSAVFMCGAAHRKSIIEKIEKFNKKECVNINWTIYGN